MRLIEKLTAKRDAAHAEYLKWQGMIDTLQSDPEFASIAHYGATKTMKAAHELVNGNGNGNGNGHGRGSGFDHAAASRKGWTPERRAEYSARLKKHNPMREAVKKKRTHKLTAAQRKVTGDRLRKLHKDPKWQAKRLRNLRKALRVKKAAAQQAATE